MDEKISAADLDVMILDYLTGFKNPKDRNQIAACISGVDSKRVASRLRVLAERGSVKQISWGRGSNPATYVINRNV